VLLHATKSDSMNFLRSSCPISDADAATRISDFCTEISNYMLTT